MAFRSLAVKALKACCIFKPNCPKTPSGTSVGFCVTKYNPTPLERISFTIFSIWSINASEACLKIKCASSINKINSGRSLSPCSGMVLYISASRLNINVENSLGLS